jgi:nitrite reductase (cytochrome c-552)
MNALIDLIGDIRAARNANKPATQVEEAQKHQRRSQFWLDFIEAENSMGFHAPQEAARILAESINFSRLGQVALRRD